MSKYQKDNIVIVIVVALLFLIIAGTIYYFYFIDYGKDYTKKDSLYVDISDDDLKEIEDVINNNNLYILSTLEKDISDINSIDTNTKLAMALLTLNNNTNIASHDVDNYFKNIFKANMYYDNSDFYCTCEDILYRYDVDNNIYIYNENHNDHIYKDVYPYYSKILSAKKKNDIYVITYTYVWDKLDEDNNYTDGYASFKDALNDQNMLFSLESENSSDIAINIIDENYDSFSSKLHEYTYIFEKEEGKYLLTGFEFTK